MSRARAPRLGSLALFWSCLALSTVAFLLPVDRAMAGPVLRFESWSPVPADKLVHALVFAGLVLLAGRARMFAPSAAPSSGLALVVWGHLLYALAIEACQHALPWRSFESLDVVADAVGIAVGTLLVLTARSHRRRSVVAEP